MSARQSPSANRRADASTPPAAATGESRTVNGQALDRGLVEDVAAQLLEELHRSVVDPVSTLLGLDLAELLTVRAGERAGLIAAQLLGADETAAAQTAIDVITSLYPDPDCDPPATWWRTPLGTALATTHRPAGVIGQRRAAEMLGVSRTRVFQLVEEGTLEAAPGGVSIASVLARLAGQATANRPTSS